MDFIQMKTKTSSGYEDIYPKGINHSILVLNYETGFRGKTYTISKDGTTYFSGTFPSTGSNIKLPIKEIGATYTLVSNSKTRSIPIPEFYTKINFPVSSVLAYIHVTYPVGSTVTCSKSGTALTGDTSGDYTFTVTSTGTWTVSCSNGSQSAQDTVSITTDGQEASVSLEYIPTFNERSWDNIKAVVNAGTAASYWKVGDRKEVVLNGTVGNKSFSNTTTYCYILGFDHNKTTESAGAHALHIGFGASALSGGAYIAYCDSEYGNGVPSAGYFSMNSSDINDGGWKQCQMRTYICPAFKNALPSDLQSNIRAVTKWQNDGGSTSGQNSSNEIWLLSEMEIFGSATYSKYTANQLQYDFYKGVTGQSAASTIKYLDTSTSDAVVWWERSANSSLSNRFCFVDTNGTANPYGFANYSYGFAPCLCL